MSFLPLQDFGEDKPVSWTHFNAEGDVEFKAILYIPPKAAHDMYDNYYSNKAPLKLYVRRVFISDEFEDLLLGLAERHPALPHTLREAAVGRRVQGVGFRV